MAIGDAPKINNEKRENVDKERVKAGVEDSKLTREKLEKILEADKNSTEQLYNSNRDLSNAKRHRVDNNIIKETEEYFLVEKNNYIVVHNGMGRRENSWEWDREKGSLGRGESRYYKVYKEDSKISPFFQSEEEAIASEKKLEMKDSILT